MFVLASKQDVFKALVAVEIGNVGVLGRWGPGRCEVCETLRGIKRKVGDDGNPRGVSVRRWLAGGTVGAGRKGRDGREGRQAGLGGSKGDGDGEVDLGYRNGAGSSSDRGVGRREDPRLRPEVASGLLAVLVGSEDQGDVGAEIHWVNVEGHRPGGIGGSLHGRSWTVKKRDGRDQLLFLEKISDSLEDVVVDRRLRQAEASESGHEDEDRCGLGSPG